MSLKQRLFGPRWQSKDAATRLDAVRHEHDRELAAALEQIATEDDDPEVRIAALRRLDDEAAWLAAADRDASDNVRRAANETLIRRFCAAMAGDNLDQRLAWLERQQDAVPLRQLAARAADAELRRAALGRIESQGFLGDCVITEPDPALAETLISRLDQPSTLKRIAERLRKSDKRRHQAVLQRLAEIERNQDPAAAAETAAKSLLHALETLIKGRFRGDRAAELERIELEWNALENIDDALQKRHDHALGIARRALAPRSAAESPPQPPAEHADDELTRLAERARSLATQPINDRTAASLDGLISAFDRRWNALHRPGPADTQQRSHFQALVAELQARLEPGRNPVHSANTRQSSTADGPAPPAELEHALEQADAALASGDVAKAHQAVAHAQSAFDRLPNRHRPAEAGGRLTRMAGRLKEMRDWQHWSNNELRERLIARVAEIDAEHLPADAVTTRLKELRERWSELDRQELLPGDKRRFAAPQSQWRRFNKGCKQAFEAARPRLEARAERQAEALGELETFLGQADQVIADPETPGDKLLRYLRAAREALRNLDTLPPRRRGEFAGKLRAAMDRISRRLEAHFEHIEQEKRRLVAEARKLEHERDRARAIDQAKALQAEWKRIGRGRRKVDDQLWREFRAPIDPLFAELDEQHRERREHERAQQQKIEALVHEAEALAENEAPAEVAGQIAGLEQRFAEAGRVAPKLAKRFERAITRHRAALEDTRRRQRQAREAHRFELAGVLQQIVSRPDAERDATPEVPRDDRLGALLLDRLQQIEAADAETLDRDLTRWTEEARQVVVEMECLAGLETPAEDQQRRMDFQVQRLSSRLGAHAPRPELAAERAELQQRWLSSFPHQPEHHQALEKRYQAAAKILDEMTTTT